jgi:putative hemolysin
VDEPPSLSIIFNISTYAGLTHPVTSFLVAALLFVSAIISACESAYASITTDQLDAFRRNPTEQVFLDLLDHRVLLLVTIRLLSNITKVAIVSILAIVLSTESQPLIISGFATLTTILVLALIVDLIPRIYGKRYAWDVIRLTGSTWRFLVSRCGPVIKRLVDLTDKTNTDFTEQEISIDKLNATPDTENKGTAPDLEKDILLGIANIGKLTVSQVMRHRSEISAIDVSSPFFSLMDYVNICGYSRIPVYRNTLDNVEGILYIKDLLPFVDYPQEFQWQNLKRPGFFVRDSRKIDALLKDFQEKRVHIAIVVDESGKTIGLVTLEDLLEEIMGVVKDGAIEGDDLTQKKQNEVLVAEDTNQ